MKRYLYLWHRWLGILLCLFMALWFVSGVVMLFVGYPKLTPAEHLQRLPPLAREDCCLPLEAVLQAGNREQAPQRLRLTSIGGAPHYLLNYPDGRQLSLDARSGEVVREVSAEQALASARQFAGTAAVEYLGVLGEDTWTHSKGLDVHRPLHLLAIDDTEQRRVYVSGSSAAVVLDATANERNWNWLGAWLHWLYPLRGGALDGWWADIVIYLSLAATLMALLGICIGVLRWRFGGRYRNGSHSPYAGLARWHHLGGMLFGLLLILWIFSGLMSMRPWGVLASQSQLALQDYRGGALQAAHFPLTAAQALQRFAEAGLEARELEWHLLAGEGFVVAQGMPGQSRILSMQAQAPVLERLPAEQLERAARRLAPQLEARFEWLQAYDFHYYQRAEQSMNGYQYKRLPALRVRFADKAGSWVHIDPYSGALIESLDGNRRSARVLFNLLHSWDWQPLLARPLLREGLIIAFSLGGLLISLTGVVLGWRRLRRSAGRPARA